jgi:hypothetical protein
MPYFFKHEIRDDMTQLLILKLDFVKPPQVRIFFIVRDKRNGLAIRIDRPFPPAMQGHDADAKTAADVGLGHTAPRQRIGPAEHGLDFVAAVLSHSRRSLDLPRLKMINK